MKSRSQELRKRSRRIFAVSLAVAAAVHVLIFAASPTFRVEDPRDEGTRYHAASDSARSPMGGLRIVDVFFGPPEIVARDGTRWQEPPDRVLEARRVEVATLSLPTECRQRSPDRLVPAEARVGVRLDADGRVVRERMVESSGDPCRDAMVLEIAGSVWYHWIPDARFPDPLELIQPVRVVAAEE